MKDIIDYLESIAARETCDGSCDEKPPYEMCARCLARHALNDISEQLDLYKRDVETHLSREPKA
jgi:hypothetical protein